LSDSGAEFPPELSDAAFIVRTGWTWDEYLNAPAELISKMIILMNAEAEAMRAKMMESEG
jgi:hypothetical protein